MSSNDEFARLVFSSRRGFDQAIVDLGSGLLEGRDIAAVNKFVRLQALSLVEITHEIDRAAARRSVQCAAK